MAKSINQVILCGRLGSDPNVRTLDNGTKVCDFSFATGGEEYTTKDGKEIKVPTQWHNIVAWRNLCELAEKALKKGYAATIFGEISYRRYQDKDGQDRYTTDIIATDIFIGGAPTGNSTRPDNPADYAQSSRQAGSQEAPTSQPSASAAPAQPQAQPQAPFAQPQGGTGELPF